MYRHGHVGAALLLYAPLGFVALLVAGTQAAFVGAIVAGGLAMLPDVDMRIPFVRHRGPTHTVWFALAVGLVLGVLGGLRGVQTGPLSALGDFAFGFLVGALTVASHVAADALTPAGVRPFWPLDDRRYTYHVARASNPIANYALLGLGSAAAILALALGNWIAALR